jgi:hypothetical protein
MRSLDGACGHNVGEIVLDWRQTYLYPRCRTLNLM